MDVLKVRKSFGLSQKDVSKIIGVSRNYISMIEKGERKLSLENETKLVEYLNIKPKADVTVLIDYLKIRLKTFRYEHVVKKLLKIPLDKFNTGRGGGHGYPCRIEHGNIKVYYQIEDTKHEENIDMGVLIEMTGSGCRLFETFLKEQDRTWREFLRDCRSYAVEATQIDGEIDEEAVEDYLNFTQFDIALDERYNPEYNYDLFKLWGKVRNNQVKTLFRHFEPHEAFSSVNGLFQSKGLSLAFGKRGGTISMEFYEKDKEQALKKELLLEDVQQIYGFKNRYEVRLSHDKAKQVIYDYAFKSSNLFELAVCIISTYLTFYDDEGDLDREWLDVLGSSKRYKFITEPKEISPEKRRRWITRQLLRELSIEYAVNKNTGIHFLMDSIRSYDFSEEEELRIEEETRYFKNKEFQYQANSTSKGRQLLEALGMRGGRNE
ncbi:helix-turn-helix domain-containing protein [Lactococcus garvieae]|nr:helix-turn-helix domain-containing protein [Lactococcus garvieae]